MESLLSTDQTNYVNLDCAIFTSNEAIAQAYADPAFNPDLYIFGKQFPPDCKYMPWEAPLEIVPIAGNPISYRQDGGKRYSLADLPGSFNFAARGEHYVRQRLKMVLDEVEPLLKVECGGQADAKAVWVLICDTSRALERLKCWDVPEKQRDLSETLPLLKSLADSLKPYLEKWAAARLYFDPLTVDGGVV